MKMLDVLKEDGLPIRDWQKTMPRYRAVYRHDDRYYGWTGLESFGVIRPLHGGWAVTCWAEVLAWVYDDGRINVCFPELEEAVKELDSLMDIAERMGRLASGPMP